MRFLCLGDSYTIGEAVPASERWSSYLVSLLRPEFEVSRTEIIAKTGWTTDELIAAIEEKSLDETFDLVSLLIGVNNQYRGYPIAQFEKEFRHLLETAIGLSVDRRVFVLTIPNWGVTPFCDTGRTSQVTLEIEAYNRVVYRVSDEFSVLCMDVCELSNRVVQEREYLANDKLHYSGAMYELWAKSIVERVKTLLNN